MGKKLLIFGVILLSTPTLWAQTIRGTVTDGSTGETLPGVNIVVKGTTTGTSTNSEGVYSLTVPSLQDTLVFSFIGYQRKEIAINGRTEISMHIRPQAIAGEEVVVVGYGTQKKASLTSAVSEINGEELVRRPVNSIQQALQGKLPGLTILDNGGSPGSPNTHIVIRGVNKPYTPVGLSTGANAQIGDNSPLVLVDGIEQPYQNINPQDIASISVLKDASSTAIYGSRAANGVVLITTKQAKEGKVSVSYDFSYALQKSVTHPEPMDIESYLRLENTAYENVGSTPPYPEREEDIEEYVHGTKSDPLKYPLPYDWYDNMLKTAPQVSHSLSVSGGSENFRARASLRFQDQQGIIANTDSKDSEVRINTSFKVSEKLNFSGDIDYRYQKVLQPHDLTNIFRLMMQNAIWAVPKYSDGTYGGGTQGNNPLLLAEQGGKNTLTSDYLIGNIKGEWEVLKGLLVSVQFAGRTTSVFGKDYVNTWQTIDSGVIKKQNLHNRLTETRNNTRQYTLNDLLKYSTNLGGHSLKFLAGYSQINQTSTGLSAYRQDFYNNDVRSISQGANDDTKDNGGGDSEWGLRSFFGRFNYAFKDKYLFEANARYDGSSRFTGANKYSFFPSFSAAWRISQEKFWGGLKRYINELKVRGSWGETGNQAVALYSYFPTLNLVNYDFNGDPVQGYIQRQDANPDLTWETTTQTNIGLDGELLNGRISLTIDYYKKRTKGILLTLPVPGTLGLQAAPQNAGIVDNKGWEFSIGARNQLGQFSLNTNLNMSINKNKVIDLADTGPYIYGSDIDPRYITAEGYPINSFWGYKTDGLFQSDEAAANYPEFMRPAKAGDVKVLDLNEDGKIDSDDMTYLGSSFPKYTFGVAFDVTFKGFALNMLFQGATDVGMRVARALAEEGNYEGFTPDIYTGNYWTPEHRNARFPRPTKRDLRNQASTDRMVVDASYLRLKNLQISYQIPLSFVERLHVDRLSIYISGTNLLTFSKLNEWHLDPESSSGWQNYYPQTAMYTIGAKLQF